MIAAARTWRQVGSRVRRQLDAGAGHRWLELDVPAAFAVPEPGQFVQLLLPPTASRTLLPRPMSVSDAIRRRDGALTLGFLYAAVGAGTHALAAQRTGDAVEVLGPLGRGFPLEQPGRPVLVAGGRGVAPLLFAARELARRGRRTALLFGARDRAHLVALPEARRALRRLGGTLHLATDDGSRGHHGHVAALLARLAPRLAREGGIVVHACGPHGMLRAVAQWGLAAGVPCHLAMESVMACGTGICRGCPLPRAAAARDAFDPATPSLYGNREWAMCCTEGPVFPAGALDWERIE